MSGAGPAIAGCLMDFHHDPVLLQEVVETFSAANPSVLMDCTVGGAGHSAALLEELPQMRLVGIDRDPRAIEAAKERLAPYGNRVTLVQARFSEALQVLRDLGLEGVDGLLADFGVSSHQLDSRERGFSFRFDGPLDMRMNSAEGEPLAEMLQAVEEQDLATIIWEYGQERCSRRVARAILDSDPFPQTTGELADIVRSVVRPAKDRLDPATRTFQALRIWVNSELDEINRWLLDSSELLNDGGVVAAISFHSLEDRAVKQGFRLATLKCVCPPKLPVCCCEVIPTLQIISKKPIVPTSDEIHRNPRSRSSRLRIAKRLTRRQAS